MATAVNPNIEFMEELWSECTSVESQSHQLGAVQISNFAHVCSLHETTFLTHWNDLDKLAETWN